MGTSSAADDISAPWSAYGHTLDGFAKPELSAPGRYIVAPVPMGSTLPVKAPTRVVAPGYMWMSGTSLSTPMVAGAAAQILARHPDFTPDQVKGALMQSASRLTGNASHAAGVGELNAVKAASLSNAPNSPGLQRRTRPLRPARRARGAGTALHRRQAGREPGVPHGHRLPDRSALLSPGLLVLLAPLHYLPSWIRRRKAGLAHLALQRREDDSLDPRRVGRIPGGRASRARRRFDGTTRFTLGGAVACAVFVAVDHLLLANMIRMTSSRSLRRTGLFAFESVSTDMVLAALGVAATAFWMSERWLMLFALAPLLIIHRAMYVPQLEEEAKVDAKTGLFNAKEFAAALHTEVARAKRPLGVSLRAIEQTSA